MTNRTITGPDVVKAKLQALGLDGVTMGMARKLVREKRRGTLRDAQGIDITYAWKYDPDMIERAIKRAMGRLPGKSALIVKLVEKSFHGSARKGEQSVIPKLDELVQEHLSDKAA